jgi:hypothetical protein
MPERLDFLSPDSGPPPVPTEDTPKPDKPSGERLEWLSPTKEADKGSSPMEGNPNAILKTDPATGVKTLLSKAGEQAKTERESVVNSIRQEQGHLPDVDYDTGTDFSDRMALTMMDNDAERRAYLGNRYGEKNVLQDPAGTFYMTKDGKKIAPTGGGVMSGLVADTVGHGDELALMARGGAMGAEVAGLPGAIVGSMVGGIGGKAINEYEKNALGVTRKSPEQTGKAYSEAGLGAGGGELGARLLSGPIDRALSGYVPRFISGATPETERLTAQTLKMGGVPPVRSALPDMKVTQFHQAFGEKLTGNMTDKRNLAAIEGEMTSVLRSGGMDEKKIPEAVKTIMNTNEAPSYAAMGNSIKDHAVQYQERLTSNVDSLIKDMNKNMDSRLAEIKTATKANRAGEPGLAENAEAAVSADRKVFSEDAQKLYGQIDNLVGDQPVVPTGPVKNLAKKIWDGLPKTASVGGKEGQPIFGDPRILKVLSEIQKAPDKVSFSDAQKVRSALGELGLMKDLTPGVSKRDFNSLKDSVDEAFGMATEGQSPQAVAVLKKADDFYKEGIKKFKNQAINELISRAETGIYPDPQKIVSLVFENGESQQAKAVMNTLPADMKDRVRGEYFTDLMGKATDPTTKQISGADLNNVLTKQGKLLDEAFGPKVAKDLHTYAQELAARDGKIPVEALTPGRISESIKAAQAAQKGLDKFLDDNYLSELAKPSLAPEMVYKHLVQPGKETELAKAFTFFGPKSPQVKQIRETALIDLMHKAAQPTASGAGNTIGPDALENALSKYTAKQKALLFPNGLDKDLESIAENAKFLFPKKGGDMAAGLAAGAVKAALPFGTLAGSKAVGGSALGAYAYGAFTNYLLSRPATIKYLALGLNSDGPAKTVALETLRGMVRAASLGMLPDVPPK